MTPMPRHLVRKGARSLLIAALFVVACHARTQAQAAAPSPEEVAEARRIFAEGVEHVERREWQEAVVCFRQVLEVRVAPPVLYNLGAALVELREYVEAEPYLRRVVDDPNADPSLVERSRHLLEEMALHGGTITLRFVGELGSGTVYLDNEPLPADRLGGPLPVASGAHTISIRDGSRERIRQRFAINERQTAEVAIIADPALASRSGTPTQATVTPRDVAQAVTPGDTSTTDGDRPRPNRRWLYVGLGTGAAIVVTVLVVVLVAGNGNSSPFEGNFNPGRLEL
jgi:hypothetical protein